MRSVLVQKTAARTVCAATAFVTAGFAARGVHKIIFFRMEVVDRIRLERGRVGGMMVCPGSRMVSPGSPTRVL